VMFNVILLCVGVTAVWCWLWGYLFVCLLACLFVDE